MTDDVKVTIVGSTGATTSSDPAILIATRMKNDLDELKKGK